VYVDYMVFNISQYNKAYRKKNKLKLSIKSKKYRAKNRETILKKKKEDWVKFYSDPKNREKERERQKIQRKNNPRRVNIWQKNNPEKFKVIQKNYTKSFKGQVAIKKSRAMRRTARFKITSQKVKKAFDKTDGKCPYCGIEISLLHFSLDHIKPIKKGGTNHLNNLIACCKSCNSKKWRFSLKQFKETLVSANL